jgi:regulatory protein
LSESGISPDSEVSVAALEEAIGKYQRPFARNDAGRYLEKSEHTAFQLQVYLLSRGYEPTVAGDVVAWAREYGYIDDLRYAKLYIRSHTDRSPMGISRLKAELRKRGIGGSIIDEAVTGREDGQLFDDLVVMVRKKYGSLNRDTAWRRAAGWLSRRGFESAFMYRVLREAITDR